MGSRRGAAWWTRVPSTSLSDLTLAMARNATLSYTVPLVIICGALLMLHGLLTLRRVCRPGGAAGPARDGRRSDLADGDAGPRLHDRRHGTGGAGERHGEVAGMARLGAGDAADGVGIPLPVRRRRLCRNGNLCAGPRISARALAPADSVAPPIVAVLAVASVVVFVTAWHSDALELAFAPVFAAMSVAGMVYMGLLGWGLARSKDDGGD